MSEKVLIVGVGISSVDKQHYGREDIESNVLLHTSLKKRYSKIIYFEYQEFLDKGAIFGDKILDPIRLKFKQKERDKIIARFEMLVDFLHYSGYDVHILGHSLFCWIAAKCEVAVDKTIFCGYPAGFITPVARFIVRQDIAPFVWSKPPLKTRAFINLYSTAGLLKEPVGSKPNTKDNLKWSHGAKVCVELNTRLTHDFKDYLRYLWTNRGLLEL